MVQNEVKGKQGSVSTWSQASLCTISKTENEILMLKILKNFFATKDNVN